MEIKYAPEAVRDLGALPEQIRERIIGKIHFYAAQDDPLRFAWPLRGHDAYRFRVGKHRIIFEVRANILIVLKVVRRDSGYKNL